MSGSPGPGCCRVELCEGGMPSWFADWRVAFAWVVTVAIASAIYFLPIARLLDSLAE
jgi:hypothetical protein